MGFSHADRVFVFGEADYQPSTIQPKRKGELSVMLQHSAVRVPMFMRLIDDTHAQRHRPGSGPVCRAAVTTAASTPSAVRVVAFFRRFLLRLFISVKTIYAAVPVPVFRRLIDDFFSS